MELIINSPKHGSFTVLYDEEDHEFVSRFTWNVRKHGVHVYAFPNSKEHCRSGMHNLFLGGKWIDHINNNTLDNRRSNLRFATPRDNARNRRPVVGSSTKFKGVSYSQNKRIYEVAIATNLPEGKTATTRNIYKAALLYNEWAKELFGEFAWLNKLTEEELELAKQPLPVRRNSTNKTGFRGVCFVQKSKKYRASLFVNGKIIVKEGFNNAEDAAKKYDELAIQYLKTTTYLNFIDGKKVEYDWR
jgi:hypothetical protein